MNFSFKRCVSLLLVAAMLVSAINFGLIIPVAAEEAGTPSSLAQLIANNYDELSAEEKAVLSSGALKDDITFEYVAPAKEANDENKLVIVDEDEKLVSVDVYKDSKGNNWIPVSFDIVADKEVKNDDIALSNGGSGDTYTGTYTYDENMFSVVVTYRLDTDGLAADMSREDQLVLLNAIKLLADDIKYMDKIKADTVYSVDLGGGNKLSLTALDVLSYLVKDPANLGYDGYAGTTVVDLLCTLTTDIEEEIILPNGDTLLEVSIRKLGNDSRDAIESLKV